jgi:excisionase family DNA binding protein
MPTLIPESEEQQIEELNRMVQFDTAALVGPKGERMEIPPSVHEVLKKVLQYMSRGKAVSIIPENQECTTQAAADRLGVSRPHLVKLLEEGKIPFTRTGSHRRIRVSDLNAYIKRRDRERAALLSELAREELQAGSYE